MSESRVRENRTHGSMRRREATPDQSATPRGPPMPPADPTFEAAPVMAAAYLLAWIEGEGEEPVGPTGARDVPAFVISEVRARLASW
jgi:hypothetical protein